MKLLSQQLMRQHRTLDGILAKDKLAHAFSELAGSLDKAIDDKKVCAVYIFGI
jgi:hypothetical protein